ncbi:hypothetical protein FQA39_LY08181 [Lamprigera yunnana]|nr:hypothetical protein FQA39_LY08181 [Lamprigera yunnana]
MSVRMLTKELQNIAIRELNENPEQINNDLEYIRDWISKQPHLKVKTDDQWLVNMLRCCRYSLEKTKKRIELLCTIKTVFPEIFLDRNPFSPELQLLLSLGYVLKIFKQVLFFYFSCVLPLPKSNDPVAPRTILIRMLDKTTNCKVFDGLKLILMTFEILMNEDDNFIIVGSQVLEDYKELSFKHLQMATPNAIKHALICLLSTYPLRAKSFHVINTSQVFKAALHLVKPFISNKLLSRVHIYKDHEQHQLKDHIPISILPKEYGGNGKKLERLTRDWKKKVESYKEWFEEDYLYKSDETKRAGNPLSFNDIFGTDGSFRQFEIRNLSIRSSPLKGDDLQRAIKVLKYLLACASMVVSTKSAFQLKLKFFEDKVQENYNYTSPNSSRRNTLELNPSLFVNLEQNHILQRHPLDYIDNDPFKKSEYEQNSKPEVKHTFRTAANNARKQFVQLENIENATVENEKPRIINDAEARTHQPLEVDQVPQIRKTTHEHKDSSIRRILKSVRASFQENNMKLINSVSDRNLASHEKNFHVILRGSFYNNPYHSLFDFNINSNYDSDDEEIYYFDFFSY